MSELNNYNDKPLKDIFIATRHGSSGLEGLFFDLDAKNKDKETSDVLRTHETEAQAAELEGRNITTTLHDNKAKTIEEICNEGLEQYKRNYQSFDFCD